MSVRSLNKVMLIGNLTRDPELRYTPQGTAVATIGLATNRSWVPNDGGERQEETEYHRLVAWGKLAEICSKILYKGRKAYVEGRLQTRKWTGQDGYERETTEVVLDSMIALGAPRGASGGSNYSDDDYYDDDSGDDVTDDYTDDQSDDQDDSEPAQDDGDEKSKKRKDEDVDVDDIPF